MDCPGFDSFGYLTVYKFKNLSPSNVSEPFGSQAIKFLFFFKFQPCGGGLLLIYLVLAYVYGSLFHGYRLCVGEISGAN
jgi:hypothetical protein